MSSSKRTSKTIVELNVPSGIMVVGNNFRDHFRILGNCDSTDELEWAKKTMIATAAIGCAHGYVRNRKSEVYAITPNKFVIASAGERDFPQGTQVASIDTDLWWYSIVDRNEFRRRGCEGIYSDAQLVPTKPGVYRFTHYHANPDHSGKAHVFAEIKWIRNPDPVKDYASEWRKHNFTAGQIIARSIEKYPTLYGGPNGVRQKANQIFCESGGDWHENGFLLYDPEMSADQVAVQIPIFDAVYRWSPMSEYSSLCCAAGIGNREITLNPSFLDLAYNVANCIVRHGCLKCPENVEIAKRCIEGLQKKYGPR